MEFVDLKRQYEAIEGQVKQRIEDVVTGAHFILGPEVAELETRLAAFAGAKHCIGVANGTDALQLVLRALGIGAGDAVFVPAFTFVATAEAVSQLDATPVFVDVLPDTFNIDPRSLESAISRVMQSSSLKPKAVIAVDLFGLPADYDKIRTIIEDHHLNLIEDAAQSMGGRIGTKMAGSFGDVATTSFFPAKPLGCYGDGGAVFTNNDHIADLLKSLRVHGRGSDKYDNVRVGLNSRLDTIQAAILLAKLDVFEEELERRDEIASFYTHTFHNCLETPTVPDQYRSAWAQYTVRVPAPQREAIRQHLSAQGIPTAVYYPKPLHRQSVYSKPHETSELPVSDALAEQVISIPVHPYMTEAECREVAKCLMSALS